MTKKSKQQFPEQKLLADLIKAGVTKSIMKEVSEYFIVTGVLGYTQKSAVLRVRTVSSKSREYALKITLNKNSLYKEASILKMLKHPGIVDFYKILHIQQKISILQEYVKYGTLEDLIRKRKHIKMKFTDLEASKIVKSILLAVQHMHQQNVAHCDLKTINILMADSKDDSQIKIIDFGISQICNKVLDKRYGTLVYIAPEIMLKTGYGKPVDLWSIGVVMYKILRMGRHPYLQHCKTKGEQTKLLKTPEQPKIAHDIDEVPYSLLKQLLRFDQNQRITVNDALKHPWITRMTNQEQEQLEIQKMNEFKESLSSQLDIIESHQYKMMKKANKNISKVMKVMKAVMFMQEIQEESFIKIKDKNPIQPILKKTQSSRRIKMKTQQSEAVKQLKVKIRKNRKNVTLNDEIIEVCPTNPSQIMIKHQSVKIPRKKISKMISTKSSIFSKDSTKDISPYFYIPTNSPIKKNKHRRIKSLNNLNTSMMARGGKKKDNLKQDIEAFLNKRYKDKIERSKISKILSQHQQNSSRKNRRRMKTEESVLFDEQQMLYMNPTTSQMSLPYQLRNKIKLPKLTSVRKTPQLQNYIDMKKRKKRQKLDVFQIYPLKKNMSAKNAKEIIKLQTQSLSNLSHIDMLNQLKKFNQSKIGQLHFKEHIIQKNRRKQRRQNNLSQFKLKSFAK